MFDLSQGNDVEQLAFTVVGTFNFVDVDSFDVVSLNYVSPFDSVENDGTNDNDLTTLEIVNATDDWRLISHGQDPIDRKRDDWT